MSAREYLDEVVVPAEVVERVLEVLFVAAVVEAVELLSLFRSKLHAAPTFEPDSQA